MLTGEDKMSIEFKENAVCYANGKQWGLNKSSFYSNKPLASIGGFEFVSFEYILNRDDFQLNEIVTGDYLPKSELDTEQKYNDAVEELGLFGFELSTYSEQNYDRLKMREFECIGLCDAKLIAARNSLFERKRKLTYNQLMAIGKLKRLMNEHKSSAVSKVNLDIERAVKSTINAELDKPTTISANKYEREISDRQGNKAVVDVYDVLKAFEVTCPATQHAVKKLLCSGMRGHKDLSTDLIEAKESIVRAIELNG